MRGQGYGADRISVLVSCILQQPIMAAVSFVVLGALLFCCCVNGNDIISLKQHVEDAQKDDYYCTRSTLPTKEGYIIEYRPHLNANVVHHMLLYGCRGGMPPKKDTWNCETQKICPEGTREIIYAWALQASGLELPEDVGFKVGGVGPDDIRYIVMEVHYHDALTSSEDIPNLDIVYTTKRQKFVAGIFLVGAMIRHGLPPGISNFTVDSECKFKGPNPMYPFAFRTHTHTHGTAMYGYVVQSQEWQLIGSRSPQDAQAFYPVEREDLIIHPGNVVASRTYYDTTNEDQHVQFGGHSSDEMSNFYIMYYTYNNGVRMTENSCWNSAGPDLIFPDSEPVLPVHGDPNHSHAHHHHHNDNDDDHTHHNKGNDNDSDDDDVSINSLDVPISTLSIQVDESWPYNDGFREAEMKDITVGDITAVDVNEDGVVYVLHRVDVHWDAIRSFDVNNVYRNQNDGPISDPVLLKIDSNGNLLSTWGRGIFYMPHGLRISTTGQYWFTDVARQQVLKTNNGMKKISVLGNKFVPGITNNEFCKPTDIELDEDNNVFYVGDGYCNHRIMAYSLTGDFLYAFPSVIEGLRLFIPHSLALNHNGTELYVADRQNQRIVVYDTITKKGRVFIDNSVLNGNIFGIAFSNRNGKNSWPLYAINGSINEADKCYGFTINEHGRVTDTWGPSEGFRESHDMAVSKDGQYIYVVQLQPNKVWRMVVHGTATTTTGEYQIKPHPSSNIKTTMNNIITAEQIVPTHGISTSIPLKPLSHQHGHATSATTTITGTTATHDISHSKSSNKPQGATSEEEEEEAYKSLFLILLIIGAVVWVVIVCAMCIGCYCARKIRLIGVKQKGTVKRHYSMNPSKKLRSLVKGNRNGFTPVNAQDSDTDEEETILFQQHKT